MRRCLHEAAVSGQVEPAWITICEALATALALAPVRSAAVDVYHCWPARWPSWARTLLTVSCLDPTSAAPAIGCM